MTDESPLVSILMPNYNGRELIGRCLRSVLNSNYHNFEVIVVDDCSVDDSAEIVRSINDERLKLVRTKVNSGPAAARNYGINFCNGKYIVFLDNDNEVDPSWISESVKIIQSDPLAAAAMCKIYEIHSDNLIQFAGLRLVPYTVWGFPIGFRERDEGQYDGVDVTWATTNGLMVTKEILSMVGGMDEKLYHYSEDLDFSLRILLTGYKILFSPNSKIYHMTKPPELRNKITGEKEAFITFHLTKNSIRTMIKNYSFSSLIKYYPSLVLINIFRILRYLGNGDAKSAAAIIRAFHWNTINLEDTLTLRRHIQKDLRRVKDRDLFEKIAVKQGIFSIYAGTKKT
jgi:GT2 family glycosyltransferase